MSEVPREYVGIARAFYRRVRTADRDYCARRDAIWRLLQARLLRRRSFRAPECQDLFRIWEGCPTFGRFGLPQSRLVYAKTRVEFHDARLMATRRYFESGTHEPAVSVAAVRLIADAKLEKQGREFTSVVGQPVLHIATFGIHAIARYWQRGFRPSEAKLIESMWSAFWSAGQVIVPGAQRFAIPLPTGGHWHGELERRYGRADHGLPPGKLDQEYTSLTVRTYHADRDDSALWVSSRAPDGPDSAPEAAESARVLEDA